MNQNNLVIRRQKSNLWYLGASFFVILLVIGAFLVGRYLALADLTQTKSALAISLQQLSETRNTLNSTSKDLIMQKQSSQVDDQSNQQLINSVKAMRQTQNDLQEELKFYRNIMAPEREQEGLSIDSLKVTKTQSSGEFHFRVTLIQAGKQSQFLKGDIIAKVIGRLDGKHAEYDFRELGPFKSKHFQFQFKYFQNIQGFIKLPTGFEVKQVSIEAQTKGRRKNQKAEKQIIWQPEESQNYVR